MKKDEHRKKTLPDEQNPIYMYSTTPIELLAKIARGKVNSRQLAIEELRKRGLDRDGKWVGFDRGR